MNNKKTKPIYDDYIITIDVDWAPDFAISKVANTLIDKKAKATWFITHNSPAIQRLSNYHDLFELGIHPNFMPGTTQGNSYSEVMEYLLDIIPSAKSLRTHGLFQSSDILKMVTVDFGLQNDASIFLRETRNIVPCSYHYGNGKILVRIPYFWAEQEEMIRDDSFILGDRYIDWPGLKVFNFHPIHIFLNSATMDNYNRLKKHGLDCTEDEAKNFINPGIGAASMFQDLVDRVSALGNSKTISDVADLYRTYELIRRDVT